MLKEWLIDYSNDVLSGEIIACQKHKWACERFLRDIEREGTDEFPYVFDDEKGLKFLRWMSLFKHRKGVLQGKNIEPHPIQVFVFGNIYGWVHKDTGYRRFKKAYWQVGRKNAKSQSLACVGTYELMALGEGSSEVYCAATKKDQAKIVWEEAEAMLNACEDLRGKFKVSYGVIRHPKSGSIFKPLSKEDGKKGDGTNPQCGIVDEYHLHPTSEVYDVIDSGMVARTQPLLMIITTAGHEINNPCYRVEYQLVSNILNPDHPTKPEDYFTMVNELDKGDDIKDESVWIKANPILCSYENGIRSLRDKLVIALDAPEKMREFLTKHMNIWVDQRENGYMALDKWKACAVKRMPSLKGMKCYAGLDLSATTDLTGLAFEFPLEDGKKAVIAHGFMPEDKLNERRKTDNVPYDLWIRKGWLSVTPGSVVDYGYVIEYFKRIVKENEWEVIENCFDKWNASHLAQELTDEGYTMVEIPQAIKYLSLPTKNFREQVLQGNIIHDGNELLTWCIGNAVTRVDSQENIMLDKSKSTNRIDLIAALINAHARAMVNEDSSSVYEERGMITF